MSADLREALRAAGIAGDVERRGALAILITADPSVFADPALRERAVRLAREHGCTHLAVEVAPNIS